MGDLHFIYFSRLNRIYGNSMASLNMRARLLLIVEDEPTDALLLRKALKGHIANMQIEHATSGADALEFLMSGALNNEQLPQLILLDLNLPGINGFELLEQVKSTDRLKEIPVVVLTSSSDSKDIQKAFSAGANSYMVKPNTYSDSVALTGNIVHYWLSLDQRSAGEFARAFVPVLRIPDANDVPADDRGPSHQPDFPQYQPSYK